MIHLLLPLLLAAVVSAQMEQIAQIAHGHVGAAVAIVETSESFAFHGSDHFPMQSVYKFPIAMAALAKVNRGTLHLDQRIPVPPGDLVPRDLHSPLRDANPQGGEFAVKDLLRYAIAESDGTASDELLRLAGAPPGVAAYLRVARRSRRKGRDFRSRECEGVAGAVSNWGFRTRWCICCACFIRAAASRPEAALCCCN